MGGEPLTYKAAGVDTREAQEVVKDIATLRQRTEQTHKLFQSFGLFAASFDLSGYRHPMILTACDGVGTKIQPLLRHDLVEHAGVDLVAMNVNDILTANALPLLFLDYIGIARIDRELIRRLIQGLSDGLVACDCILAGGETAEMPGLVEPGIVELSGFCVGAAEKEELLDPSTVTEGDLVFGVPSDGFHANGWSLIRKILERQPDLLTEAEQRALLTPTRIYFDEVKALRDAGLRPRAMAHITGGGIPENFERVLGEHGARLQLPAWENEPVQKVLAGLDTGEALHTFNMGIGWIIVTAPGEANLLRSTLPEAVLLGDIAGDQLTVEIAR